MTFTPEPPSINVPMIFSPWTRMSTPGQCGSITFEPISKLATCTLAAGAGCNDFVQPSLNLGTNHRSCSSVIMIWNPIRSDRSALGSSLSWMSVACFAFASSTYCCVYNRTASCSTQASLALLSVVTCCTASVILFTCGSGFVCSG